MGRRQKTERSPKDRNAGKREKKPSRAPVLADVTPPITWQAVASRYATPVVCCLLLVAVLAVFGQSLGFDFLNYDDGPYVAKNAAIQRGLSWATVAWSLTSFEGANWHPVTWLSHAMDCQLFGLWPGGHHGVNVALHAANSILLFLLLVRLTAATWRSAIVAALFALHPLHVESVAWVAERKDVLSTLFAMLTMLAYVRYAGRPSAIRYALVMVLFALGLMSKPMLVTLPFVLLLLDYWPLQRWKFSVRSAIRLLLEKTPLLALAAASSVVTCIAQQSKGAMAMLSDDISFPLRLSNALVAYVAYLGKTLWPAELIIFYPYPPQRPTGQPLLAALFLIAVTILVFRLWRTRPYLAVGWFWFLGTLVPVIGLVQVGAQSMADRYTYVPLIGIFIAGVWSIGDLTASWRWRRAGLATLSATLILACMILSFRQTARWADNYTLFSYVLSVSPDNSVGHSSLGDELFSQNRCDEAEYHYRELARIEPIARARAQLRWGETLLSRSRPAEAATHFREALRLDPDMAVAHNDLGMALLQVGTSKEVLEQFDVAARLAPDKPEVLNNLAWALTHCPNQKLRNATKAAKLASRAIELSYRQEPSYLATLAVAYHLLGKANAARQIAQEAVDLANTQKKPIPPDALQVLGQQQAP